MAKRGVLGVGWGRSVRFVAALAAVLTTSVVLAACGGSGVSSQEATQIAQNVLNKYEQQQKLKALQGQVNALKHGQPRSTTGSSGSSSSSGSSQPGTSCGNGVSAGPNTTCGFAQNVASAYRSSPSSVVNAYSPTTNDHYSMTCSGSNPTVCRGGNNASVYIY
jgi:hypothetical protein